MQMIFCKYIIFGQTGKVQKRRKVLPVIYFLLNLRVKPKTVREMKKASKALKFYDG